MPNKGNGYRWVVLSIVCFALFSPTYAQYQLSPLAPQLIAELGLSTSQFASIFSAPMIPAIFLSLVAGILVDKMGIKLIIAIGLVITAVGACFRIASSGGSGSYSILFISMLLTGFGAAFINANGPKILGNWFPPEKVGAAMGILLSASTVAMTVGMATTALLPSIQVAYILAAIPAVASALMWILFMRSPVRNEIDKTPAIPMIDCLKVVCKCRGVWLVGFCLMGILGCIVIISSFLPAALGERGISSVSAGAYGSAVTIGNMIGCMSAPLLCAKVGKNKPVISLLAVISVVGVALSWQAPQGPMLALSLCITGIAMGGLMPILMSIPIQLPEIGPAYAGTAGGFTSTLQLLGAVVIPTYIVAPIAGTNMHIFFLAGGACMTLVFLMGLAIPEIKRQGQN